jgi:hypothetical protein
MTAVGLLFAIWSLLTLHLTEGPQIGPGMFPAILGAGLALLGGGIALKAVITGNGDEEMPVGKLPWRPILLISAAPVVFAIAIENFGLVAACFFTVFTATLASKAVGFVRGLIVSIVLTAFCVVIFHYGAGLTTPLFWR